MAKVSYYSQWQQDKILNENIFKGKKNGVFVDIGAHDGISGSNSYFFEKELGWTGLCVEPILERYCDLVKNRSCICMNCCVYSKNCLISFFQNKGYTEMLSGIFDSYDLRHMNRIITEQKAFGGETIQVKKPAYTLSDLLKINNISRVDYLSIDTEGSEYDILLGLDFKQYPVHVIDVECNYPDTFGKIDKLLTENGFNNFSQIEGDRVYINNKF